MTSMNTLQYFLSDQIETVNNAVAMAEELVSNAYKMSASQWLRRLYDVKTLTDLSADEIVHGPFAQIIRYKGQRKDTSLETYAYDFYKICLQDHSILEVTTEGSGIELFPFTLYIVSHELIHIVRFSQFLQNFNASPEERMVEEQHVHSKSHTILKAVKISGLPTVLNFYEKWRTPVDEIRNP